VLDFVHSVTFFFAQWDFNDPLALLACFASTTYIAGILRLRLKSRRFPFAFRQMGAAIGGFFFLILALAGPFDVFAYQAFWPHMIQHLLLSMVAAPLLLISNPMPVFLWTLPQLLREGAGELLRPSGQIQKILRLIIRPQVTLPFYILILYAWHVPDLFTMAINNSLVHYLQHFTFFLSAMLFWWPIIGPAPLRSKLNYPQRLLYIVLAITPTALIAAIITLSTGVIYDHYLSTSRHWQISALEDQTIAGIIMWIPGNLVYLTSLTIIFFSWANKEDKRAITARK